MLGWFEWDFLHRFRNRYCLLTLLKSFKHPVEGMDLPTAGISKIKFWYSVNNNSPAEENESVLNLTAVQTNCHSYAKRNVQIY